MTMKKKFYVDEFDGFNWNTSEGFNTLDEASDALWERLWNLGSHTTGNQYIKNIKNHNFKIYVGHDEWNEDLKCNDPAFDGISKFVIMRGEEVVYEDTVYNVKIYRELYDLRDRWIEENQDNPDISQYDNPYQLYCEYGDVLIELNVGYNY